MARIQAYIESLERMSSSDLAGQIWYSGSNEFKEVSRTIQGLIGNAARFPVLDHNSSRQELLAAYKAMQAAIVFVHPELSPPPPPVSHDPSELKVDIEAIISQLRNRFFLIPRGRLLYLLGGCVALALLLGANAWTAAWYALRDSGVTAAAEMASAARARAELDATETASMREETEMIRTLAASDGDAIATFRKGAEAELKAMQRSAELTDKQNP